MKKLFAIMALAISSTAFAANFVSVDVDTVTPASGGTKSTAQYVRAGAELGGIQYGLQSRTARLQDGSGLFNSLEVTAGKNLAGVTPFVGVGHDNGPSQYTYGLVGATTALKAGPGLALLGAKTRVASTEADRTKQTVVFATYAIPVAKNVSLNLNASKSYQDIKEKSIGLGLGFSF